MCPCAQCVNEVTGERMISVDSIDPQVRIMGVAPWAVTPSTSNGPTATARGSIPSTPCANSASNQQHKFTTEFTELRRRITKNN